MDRLKSHPNLGQLLTPANGNSVATILASGLPWACDNGAFSGFDTAAYLKLCLSVRNQPRLLWVACPDVVANATETAEIYARWGWLLKDLGLPVAYVAQNGLQPCGVPWADIACLFVGGTTAWKEGREAARLILEAKERGLWVHVGRVNSLRRLMPLLALGVDSIDGGQFSMFSETYIPRFLRVLAGQQSGMKELLSA